MKRIILTLLILIITAGGVFSDDIFFPAKKGAVLLTANINENGRIVGYNRMTIRDVRGSGGNMTVVYSMRILDRNLRPARNSEDREYNVSIANGVSMYRLDDVMDAYFTTRGLNYTMTAGNMNVPSNLTQGSRLENTWLKIVVQVPIVGTVTAETVITNLVCGGIETVTVPAGTFEAYKVTQTSTTTTTGWGRSPIVNTGITWYARGIGVVKSISYDSRGRLESSTELHEMQGILLAE